MFAALMTLFACRGENKRMEEQTLNDKAYSYFYVSIDSVDKYANLALKQAERHNGYSDEKLEAMCNLGFAKFMEMRYDSAQIVLNNVVSNSNNELFSLFADVMLMKICQRMSVNDKFYEYADRAKRRMDRIRPEANLMDKRQERIWNFTVSEYHFVQAIFNYYLRQQEEADKELIDVYDNINIVQNDTAQLAMLCFLTGNSRTLDKILDDQDAEKLFVAASLANSNKLDYILAKALTSIAEDITNSKTYRPSRLNLIREIIQVDDSITNDLLPLHMELFALDKFKKYGSLFDISQTYIAISDFYLDKKMNEEALNQMQLALEEVNKHHQSIYHDQDKLYPFELNADSVSTEMRWIGNDFICVPEWMADVREHLSIVYSALGRKEESDFNWNIRLDILEVTRRDKKVDQIYELLTKERTQLDKRFTATAIAIVFLSLAVYILVRRIRNNYKKNYLREKAQMEQEMERWREKSDNEFSFLKMREEQANCEREDNERRLEEQKERYIDKSTCMGIVYAINPFLDRAVNEVKKIKEDIQRNPDVKPMERLEYLNELIDRINLYNDILANWIQIRQGEVALNIENFNLQPLFDIMEKSKRNFMNYDLKLLVQKSQLVVKADRALTLFMINTLLDNARKFSDKGGTVTLSAKEIGQDVEISVKDEGRGVSEEDIKILTSEKVYDSTKIGSEDVKERKGFGFGIMNCKGIIEKYKKTSQIFSGCLFGVESKMGEGSRFFFRLPKGGARKILIAILGLFMATSVSLKAQQFFDTYIDNDDILVTDAWDILDEEEEQLPEDQRLLWAYHYADLMNQCNEQYRNVKIQQIQIDDDNALELPKLALQYADSACMMLNDFYIEQQPHGKLTIALMGDDMPDIQLRKSGFKTSYRTILGIRNEVAIASLALNLWDMYYYNVEIYNQLFKLVTHDEEKEKKCMAIKQQNNNMQTLFYILIVTGALALMAFYFIYYHYKIMPTFELRQILEINRRIFNNNDDSKLPQIIQQGLNEIRKNSGVALLLNKTNILMSDNAKQPDNLHQYMRKATEINQACKIDNGRTMIYPLNANGQNPIGAIAFSLDENNAEKEDDTIFRMIAKYTAVNIYFSNTRMQSINGNIEEIEDMKNRAERETNIVHVQNMVIDNTLSTIKHETMYYPNRIAQIAQRLRTQEGEEKDYQDLVNNMVELVTYYKEIFTILSQCASSQIQQPMFKRKNITIEDIENIIAKTVELKNRKAKADVKLICKNMHNENGKTAIIADQIMLHYLINNVVEAFFNENANGNLLVDFDMSQDFIKFAFYFDFVKVSQQQIDKMFYPEALIYDKEKDKLNGAQMLIAKQIIREHDDHVRRGCRISAQKQNDKDGITISFSLPAAKKHS